MGSLMQDLKRQASFFLREKIKTARLVLTDVTPAQLYAFFHVPFLLSNIITHIFIVFGSRRLTEELTNGESMAPDVQSMSLISKAAFEVDDYDRIVQILHNRLSKFDPQNWQASYKALLLLEHLLTHGPQRIAEEFECDEDVIRDMANFHCLDYKGFDWGSSVKKKSERVVDLLEDRSYLKEERARARKLTLGIKGFGSVSHRSLGDVTSKDTANCEKIILRSKTHHQYITDYHQDADENDLLKPNEYMQSLLSTNKIAENDLKGWSPSCSSREQAMELDHPFWDKENHTRVSLLSS